MTNGNSSPVKYDLVLEVACVRDAWSCSLEYDADLLDASSVAAMGRAWIDLLGSLVFLLPVTIFVAWISWEYISDSWAVLEGSREAGGLPAVFLLKSLILVLALMLTLQALVQIYRSLQLIKRTD